MSDERELLVREAFARRAPLPDDLVESILRDLEQGSLRAASVDWQTGTVTVHEWVKEAIVLAFASLPLRELGSEPFRWVDRIALRDDLAAAKVRAVPGSVVRRGTYLAPGVTLMPSFVNVGAWIGADTLVDTWATVGSCAQVGERVHLSGGVGIGGVLGRRRAAAGLAGDRRRRRLHRLARDRRRGSDRRPWCGRRRRRGRDADDPGYRRHDRRGARTRARSGLVCRRRWDAGA